MIESINLQLNKDNRGSLYSLNELPFSISRIFLLNDLTNNSTRGGHAHHQLQEILICLEGYFDLLLVDKKVRTKIRVNKNLSKGYIIPPNNWRELSNFSSNCLVLSLCSHPLNETDYIRDFNEFINNTI